MFNAPRRPNGQSLSSSAFISSSTGSGPSYADPLAQSTPNASYGEVDPWSAVPSPARSGTPRRESQEVVQVGGSEGGAVAVAGGREGLNAFFGDPPALYLSLLDQMDTSSTGTVSLAAVHRTLSTSKLPAATIEKIMNLTARDKSSLSRQELFCSLALVAFAQSSPSEDLSIENLSHSLPNLPLPRISVPSSSPSYIPEDSPAGVTDLPEASSSSPWGDGPVTPGIGRTNGHYPEPSDFSTTTTNAEDDARPGAFSVGTERGYWKRLEHVQVGLITEKEGWFLQKYRVESDKRPGEGVSRRYSDFVWLLDCLIKRYPFRLLPALPPKKIGPDAMFLEQRRKALQRFINAIVNHPVMRDDGALNVFLTEPAFESWRKRTKVSTDEESASKSLSKAQEMAIPSDLEEKLGNIRDHLPSLLASYQKLVLVAERGLARLQANAADASRLALSMGTVAEEMPRGCYLCVGGGSTCSLCHGVGRGLGAVGEHWTRVAEQTEKQATSTMLVHIEALKAQRDLYLAFRDLFARHDNLHPQILQADFTEGLSKDTVDALRKKVEGRVKKVETHKSGQKPGWELEVDKLVASNDADNTSIANLLSRRIFIKACMWHELAVVFHSRQAAQTTLGWRAWTKSQEEAHKALGSVWEDLGEQLKTMPIE